MFFILFLPCPELLLVQEEEIFTIKTLFKAVKLFLSKQKFGLFPHVVKSRSKRIRK